MVIACSFVYVFEWVCIFTAGIRIVLTKIEIDSYILHVITGSIIVVVCMNIAERKAYITFLFNSSKGLKIIREKRNID